MSDNHHDESEHEGIQLDIELSLPARRALAIHELLVEKGIIGQDEIRERAELFRSRSPSDGAKAVRKRGRIRLSGSACSTTRARRFTNSATSSHTTRNLRSWRILMTCIIWLCVLYALAIQRRCWGRLPTGNKSFAYRQRAVVGPRSVMREFGLELNEDMQVRVVDRTADLRYLVLPRRPAGTDGMSEVVLAAQVTRASMVGVSEALSPQVASKA